MRADRDGAGIRVSVEDEGPGIDAQRRAPSAAPFVTSDPGASTGIGLTIVRAIVEAHGGALTIGPRPGGGTAVSFTIPVSDG